MIKKARDIQLGDRIGGRLVVATQRWHDNTTVSFLDAEDVIMGVGVPLDTNVWVDDPITSLPVLHSTECCQPTDSAFRVMSGNILYFRLVNHDNLDIYTAAVHFDKGGFIHTCFPDGVSTIKEVATCTISRSGLPWA